MLPGRPVDITRVEPWWIVDVGFVTEDDIKVSMAVLDDVMHMCTYYNMLGHMCR